MVYGQMNEPPGNRLRVALTGLTMAEKFRDEKTSRARAATCCCSSTTSTATRSPAPKCPHCSVGCHRRWVTSRTSPKKWACCRSASPRRRPARSRRSKPCTSPRTTSPTRRLQRPSRTSTRPSCRSPDRRARHLSGGGPARLDQPAARSAGGRRGALQHCARRAGGAAALQGAAGHHRDPRHGRAVGRGQAHRVPRTQDPAVPVAAVLRRRRCSPARPARSCR